MLRLDLTRLKKNKEAILKAEIVSMLTLWKKVLPGTGINKIDKNVNNIDWQNLLSNIKIRFEDVNNNIIKEFKIWDEFLNNWRKWRKQTSTNYLLQILYGISESLNSGIDKGSPKDDVKVEPKNERWLANAFGSYKRKIIYLEKTETEINNLIDEIKVKTLHILNKTDISLEDLEEVRNKIKELLSGLLSDDRFPINDVSLWEQTYMSTSMFKALLSNYVLTHSDFNKIPNSQDMKWRILGIQYDKIGIAEKSLKLASISWYREVTKKIDEEVKRLLEIEYPIGNEIYRDETGIYFIVGEDLGKDLNDNSNLAESNDSLGEIEDKILRIFEEKTNYEFYPSIFLTKASRGLMNLSTLLSNAKSNSLKAKWRKKRRDLECQEIGIVKKKTCALIHRKETEVEENGQKIPNFALGICPICRIRPIFVSDKRKKENSPTVCKVCYNRIYEEKGRVKNWIHNSTGETIWIGEVKDKNDRVAYVSLKFELQDWLNGNLFNSNLNRRESFNNHLQSITKLFKKIAKYYKNFKNGENKNLEKFKGFRNTEEIKIFIKFFDEKGIQKPFNDVKGRIINLLWKNSLSEEEKKVVSLFKRIFFSFLIEIWNEIKEKKKTNNKILNKSKNIILDLKLEEIDKEKFKNYYQQGGLNLLLDIFAFGFVYFQIKNILLERSIGQAWEEFIYKQLNDWDSSNKKPLKQKINFDDREIYWAKLNDNDIGFLSILLLQFLLRKNPSPARLRRIWENTREFFEKIEKDIMEITGIPDDRCIRLYWDGINSEEGEYWSGNLEFWVLDRKAFLITYDGSIIENYRNGNDFEFKLERKNKKSSLTLKLKDAKVETYKPYMSIIDPTPVSWQFIIPAEYVPNLIDKVLERYNENFKYVYGKLPLHIGIVIQDYKRPLYVGLNALRRIRRDVKNTEDLWLSENAGRFCIKYKKKSSYATPEELCNKTEDYYSLYWENPNEEGYLFYIKPEEKWKKWISTLDKFNPTDKVQYIPNTFDFEFLDTNTRRNDIYYGSKGKRAKRLKANRPYELESFWEKFKIFKEIFSDKTSSSKLHKLISLLYSKLDGEEFDERHSYLLSSAFVNILELKKNEELKDGIFRIFGVQSFKELTERLKKREKVLLFLDMFEFWHTALKEV